MLPGRIVAGQNTFINNGNSHLFIDPKQNAGAWMNTALAVVTAGSHTAAQAIPSVVALQGKFGISLGKPAPTPSGISPSIDQYEVGTPEFRKAIVDEVRPRFDTTILNVKTDRRTPNLVENFVSNGFHTVDFDALTREGLATAEVASNYVRTVREAAMGILGNSNVGENLDIRRSRMGVATLTTVMLIVSAVTCIISLTAGAHIQNELAVASPQAAVALKESFKAADSWFMGSGYLAIISGVIASIYCPSAAKVKKNLRNATAALAAIERNAKELLNPPDASTALDNLSTEQVGS